jgi:hypothetical protein
VVEFQLGTYFANFLLGKNLEKNLFSLILNVFCSANYFLATFAKPKIEKKEKKKNENYIS